MNLRTIINWYKKKNRKGKKTWKENKNSTFFLLGLFLSLFGLHIFYVGFHNFDSAQNMIFIRDDVSIDLLEEDIDFDMGVYIEHTSRGNILTLEESYMLGVRQILQSVIFIIIGFFGMGYYFRRLEETK